MLKLIVPYDCNDCNDCIRVDGNVIENTDSKKCTFNSVSYQIAIEVLFTEDNGIIYFEINIKKAYDNKGCIGIGIIDKTNINVKGCEQWYKSLVGSLPNSYGYHGDDG